MESPARSRYPPRFGGIRCPTRPGTGYELVLVCDTSPTSTRLRDSRVRMAERALDRRNFAEYTENDLKNALWRIIHSHLMTDVLAEVYNSDMFDPQTGQMAGFEMVDMTALQGSDWRYPAFVHTEKELLYFPGIQWAKHPIVQALRKRHVLNQDLKASLAHLKAMLVSFGAAHDTAKGKGKGKAKDAGAVELESLKESFSAALRIAVALDDARQLSWRAGGGGGNDDKDDKGGNGAPSTAREPPETVAHNPPDRLDTYRAVSRVMQMIDSASNLGGDAKLWSEIKEWGDRSVREQCRAEEAQDAKASLVARARVTCLPQVPDAPASAGPALRQATQTSPRRSKRLAVQTTTPQTVPAKRAAPAADRPPSAAQASTSMGPPPVPSSASGSRPLKKRKPSTSAEISSHGHEHHRTQLQPELQRRASSSSSRPHVPFPLTSPSGLTPSRQSQRMGHTRPDIVASFDNIVYAIAEVKFIILPAGTDADPESTRKAFAFKRRECVWQLLFYVFMLAVANPAHARLGITAAVVNTAMCRVALDVGSMTFLIESGESASALRPGQDGTFASCYELDACDAFWALENEWQDISKYAGLEKLLNIFYDAAYRWIKRDDTVSPPADWDHVVLHTQESQTSVYTDLSALNKGRYVVRRGQGTSTGTHGREGDGEGGDGGGSGSGGGEDGGDKGGGDDGDGEDDDAGGGGDEGGGDDGDGEDDDAGGGGGDGDAQGGQDDAGGGGGGSGQGQARFLGRGGNGGVIQNDGGGRGKGCQEPKDDQEPASEEERELSNSKQQQLLPLQAGATSDSGSSKATLEMIEEWRASLSLSDIEGAKNGQDDSLESIWIDLGDHPDIMDLGSDIDVDIDGDSETDADDLGWTVCRDFLAKVPGLRFLVVSGSEMDDLAAGTVIAADLVARARGVV